MDVDIETKARTAGARWGPLLLLWILQPIGWVDENVPGDSLGDLPGDVMVARVWRRHTTAHQVVETGRGRHIAHQWGRQWRSGPKNVSPLNHLLRAHEDCRAAEASFLRFQRSRALVFRLRPPGGSIAVIARPIWAEVALHGGGDPQAVTSGRTLIGLGIVVAAVVVIVPVVASRGGAVDVEHPVVGWIDPNTGRKYLEHVGGMVGRIDPNAGGKYLKQVGGIDANVLDDFLASKREGSRFDSIGWRLLLLLFLLLFLLMLLFDAHLDRGGLRIVVEAIFRAQELAEKIPQDLVDAPTRCRIEDQFFFQFEVSFSKPVVLDLQFLICPVYSFLDAAIIGIGGVVLPPGRLPNVFRLRAKDTPQDQNTKDKNNDSFDEGDEGRIAIVSNNQHDCYSHQGHEEAAQERVENLRALAGKPRGQFQIKISGRPRLIEGKCQNGYVPTYKGDPELVAMVIGEDAGGLVGNVIGRGRLYLGNSVHDGVQCRHEG